MATFLFSKYCERLTSRRSWLGAAALGLLTACGRTRSTGYAGHAFVATAGEDSLAAVDLTRFQLARAIPLGAAPHAVVTDAARKRVYTAAAANGTIHGVDATGLTKLFSHRIAASVSAIRFSPNARQLFALSPESKELLVMDVDAVKVSRRLKLAAVPRDLDVFAGPAGELLFAAVSGGDSGIVEFFDLTSGQHAQTQLAGPIGSVLFRGDGQLLLVANRHDRSITALESGTLRTIADLPLAMQPDHLCFGGGGGQLFVSGAGMDGVAIVFPYHTLQVEQTVLAARTPGAMACSSDPNYLFVAQTEGSGLSVLNVEDRKVIGVTQVGSGPGLIRITPGDQYALVLNQGSGDMAVIGIQGIRAHKYLERNKSGASLLTMIPVGATPLDLAII